MDILGRCTLYTPMFLQDEPTSNREGLEAGTNAQEPGPKLQEWPFGFPFVCVGVHMARVCVLGFILAISHKEICTFRLIYSQGSGECVYHLGLQNYKTL